MTLKQTWTGFVNKSDEEKICGPKGEKVIWSGKNVYNYNLYCATWKQMLLGVSIEEEWVGGGRGYVPERGDRIHIENFSQRKWSKILGRHR
jgi:hypothetical protein